MPCGCTSDATVGGRLGASLGYAAGTALQYWGEQAVATLLGGGDYTVSGNALVAGGGTMSAQAPTFSMGGKRQIRVRNSEYLGAVKTHPDTVGAFFNENYPINPGNLKTFPWLSHIAEQFEQWTALGIVFEYRPSSSALSTNVVLGTINMATEYDLRDPLFANKTEMLNSAFSNSVMPSDRAIHGIECAPGDTAQWLKYVAISQRSISFVSDPEEYFQGLFQIATQGSAAPVGTILGDLWIHYDILLTKSALINGIPNRGPLWAIFSCSDYTDALPLGTVVTQNAGNFLAPAFVGGTTIRFPRYLVNARFQLFFYWQGPGLVAPVAPTPTLQGMVLSNPTIGTFTSATAGGGDRLMYTFTVTIVEGLEPKITFAGAALPGPAGPGITPRWGEFRIQQVSDQFESVI